MGAPVHDAASIRALEAAAIARGADPYDLMMAAAAAVAGEIEWRYPRAVTVRVVAGGGTNGGDGLLAAARLAERGHHVTVHRVTSRPPEGLAARADQDARAAAVDVIDRVPTSAELATADVIVDALLGTGTTGPIRPQVGAAIDAIVAAGRPVVAVDIPSGVDPSTGEVAGPAVAAAVTVTFGAAKLGTLIDPGRGRTGELVVASLPIGVADGAVATLAGADVLERVPPRARSATKYTAGSVACVGGRRGLVGSIVLAGTAAFGAGAGHVALVVPEAIADAADALLLEAVTVAVDSHDGGFAATAGPSVAAATARTGAVLVGPGCGRDDGARMLVDALWRARDGRLVVDADGLQVLARLAPDPRSATILTPHAAEAAALLDSTPDDVARRRLASARALADRYGAVCVLKGPDTIIVAPDGRLAIRDGDDPALATAGSGDVLAGTIAALFARVDDPFLAAAAGTVAHLEAGRRAAAGGRVPRASAIAAEVHVP